MLSLGPKGPHVSLRAPKHIWSMLCARRRHSHTYLRVISLYEHIYGIEMSLLGSFFKILFGLYLPNKNNSFQCLDGPMWTIWKFIWYFESCDCILCSFHQWLLYTRDTKARSTRCCDGQKVESETSEKHQEHSDNHPLHHACTHQGSLRVNDRHHSPPNPYFTHPQPFPNTILPPTPPPCPTHPWRSVCPLRPLGGWGWRWPQGPECPREQCCDSPVNLWQSCRFCACEQQLLSRFAQCVDWLCRW